MQSIGVLQNAVGITTWDKLCALLMALRRKLLMLVALLLAALIDMKHRKKRRRRDILHVRALLSPLGDGLTCWKRLLLSEDNSSYIRTLGLGICKFETILTPLIQLYSLYYCRNKSNYTYGRNTGLGRPRALDAAAVLGLALHWFRTTCTQ